MTPAEKLLAAAEEIESQIETGVDALPWRVSETSDDPDRPDTSWILGSDGGDVAVSNFADDPDFALIVTAVNAMPTVATWLRETARAYPSDQAVDHPALTLARQILGGES